MNPTSSGVGLTRQESGQVVESLFEIMKGALANGQDLLISGFGKSLRWPLPVSFKLTMI